MARTKSTARIPKKTAVKEIEPVEDAVEAEEEIKETPPKKKSKEVKPKEVKSKEVKKAKTSKKPPGKKAPTKKNQKGEKPVETPTPKKSRKPEVEEVIQSTTTTTVTTSGKGFISFYYVRRSAYLISG